MPAPMPTVGGSAAGLTNDVNNLAPLATTWSGPSVGVPVAQNIRQASYTPGPSFQAGLGSFFANAASSIGHMAVGAASFLAKSTAQMAEGAYHFPTTAFHSIRDDIQLHSVGNQITMNNNALHTLNEQYRSGQISASVYKTNLKEITDSIAKTGKVAGGITARTAIDSKNLVNDTIQAGSAVITVMTAGIGDIPTMLTGKTAAEFFLSDGATPFLAKAEQAINTIATNSKVLGTLDPIATRALETTTAEAVAKATPSMVGKEIARVAATNLALKYPLYYSAIEPTAQQLYTELENKKYGQAVQTIAVNAGMLLGGGVIGKALSEIKAAGGLSKYVFGQSSFWDEASKFYGKAGNTDGFMKAIQERVAKMSPEDAKAYIKDLSAVEATNLHAAGGDAVAAAQRMVTGMKSYEGLDLHTIEHGDALDNMVTFAKAQRIADAAGKKLGMGSITVGRMDARDKQVIAEISKSNDPLKAWNQIRIDNPTRAYANNQNVDTQIKALIELHKGSPAALERSIMEMNTAFRVKGFPEDIGKQLTKMGYIPIKPQDLKAPFKEGTGQLLSAHANTSNDFFLKASQPLPILGHIGSLLTAGGLSPQASTQRVYQLFHEQLTNNLKDSQALVTYADRLVANQKALDAGKAVEEQFTKNELDIMHNNAADTMIKKLSDYAKDPTRGGIPLNETRVRFPITDLRQLTKKDIMAALNMSAKDANEVRGALMDSMLNTKMLATTGLGDALVSANYKYNPIAGSYARAQGALRFAWNPIFAAKLQYKSEILTQAEAGGHFPTLLGTNWFLSKIFQGKYAQLDAITNTLRDYGILDQKGIKRIAVTGEGVNDSGVMSANLTHALLPGQERSIAALISTQADKVGMNVHDFIANFPHEVADTVQTIAQYDRHSTVLNSPLMRTLNLAFFPARFETKVAIIMAKSLAAQPAMTQFAIIKGLYDGQQWLNSPEGKVWYSQNANVIGMFKYFSPLSTLATVAQICGTHGETVGAYGELGGLPFGFITQTLDAAGITNFGTQAPMVSSKTGEIVPTYVPVNARGDVQLAIQDFLSGLFTYPGATVGLPGKTTIVRNVTRSITPTAAKSDFTPVTPAITPEQEQYQKLVQAQQGNSAPAPAGIPQPGTTQGSAVPAQPSALQTPIPKKGSASGTGKAAKKKKAQFTPELLPGQSQLGQL